MNKFLNDDYVLIAKHCPQCGALVAAEKRRSPRGEYFTCRRCSCCHWSSPLGSR